MKEDCKNKKKISELAEVGKMNNIDNNKKFNNQYCFCSVSKQNSKCFIEFRTFLFVSFALSLIFRPFVVLADMRGTNKNYDCNQNCQKFNKSDSEIIKEMAEQTIMQKILAKMGYTELPKTPNTYQGYSFPPVNEIMNIYGVTEPMAHRHKPSTDESHLYEYEEKIKNQVLGTFAEPCQHDCPKLWNMSPLTFNFDKTVLERDVRAVKIIFKYNLDKDEYFPDQEINLTIYKQVPRTLEKKRYEMLRSLKHILPPKENNRTLFDVEIADQVRNHIKENKNNIVLVFVVGYTNETYKGKKPLLLNPGPTGNIVLSFGLQEKTTKRSKRQTVKLECEENDTQLNCCRYPLTIDFEKMKWDFVIAPRKYDANYCAGECPYMWASSAHAHLAHLTNSTKAGPCCSPKTMSSISMLYFTPSGNILFGQLPNMKVERCGCS